MQTFAQANAGQRADQVGSLLRPAALKQARARFQAGEIPAEELHRVEDEEIRRVIRTQEDIGLQAVTDGEFRRSWWHFDFLKKLDGVEGFEAQSGIQFHGVQTRAEGVRVTGRVGFSGHPMLEHFKFLAANTKVVPKMTIPSPTLLHFRGGRKEISSSVYPDLDAFFDDLGRAYKKAVKAFYDAGCRYLQFDDTVWAYLCSKEQLQLARERGEEVEKLPRIYAEVINAAISDRPHDMVITTHVCRGNFRSTWISEGGYEPVAERLLGEIDYDGYFLEYDTERAGGFEPLRFLPKGKKIVVLGLVTSKTGTLEDADAVKRRIDEASKFAPLDQLALSPQCGFASTEEGNILADQEQWAKLSMIVEISREVWG
ncbi:5-methyltetrahydropteroyltriglutamate--homocysteine S-methyltransferase [Rhodoplanes elegans]|uniref:5-methyltetrahydropteroyltriglutamate--homocysteine S-methyltransferase n=1 Tax=Rhodoplanes elegans TaxID=29408 RepID=A0A327KRD6_9BRAD|nr:cobalamin-independent methionine synthase II family protein [Rhodoplanes elegans]RAI39892.1 5-methyltetrahydropteroyltriglutamate--homocysteine S-methyltransferase [Rhodoplanes elegans]